ncbi:MAG TPA: hypothetical protein V6D12_21525 [Candidatus Obscuribacterales bacterium]
MFGALLGFFIFILIPVTLFFVGIILINSSNNSLGCLAFMGYILAMFIVTRFVGFYVEEGSLKVFSKSSSPPSPALPQEIKFDENANYNLDDPETLKRFCSHFDPFPANPKNLKVVDDYVEKCGNIIGRGQYGKLYISLPVSRFCCFVVSLKNGTNDKYKLEDLSAKTLNIYDNQCDNRCYDILEETEKQERQKRIEKTTQEEKEKREYLEYLKTRKWRGAY